MRSSQQFRSQAYLCIDAFVVWSATTERVRLLTSLEVPALGTRQLHSKLCSNGQTYAKLHSRTVKPAIAKLHTKEEDADQSVQKRKRGAYVLHEIEVPVGLHTTTDSKINTTDE